jgi:hypothetical protein
MHIPAFVSHRPFARVMPARAPHHLSAPMVNRRALRVWLDQPGREPTPVAGHMYGLLLRPVDRQDIGGDRR